MSQSEEPPTPTLETEVLRHLAREWKLDLDGWRDYESNFTTRKYNVMTISSVLHQTLMTC